jgi:ATP-dependent Clp protease ATP-binding subunit ClpX
LVARQLVDEFARRFRECHGISLKFTEPAAELLVNEALEKNQPVRDLCAARFKDFQFGLKLITQNSGVREFQIDVETVQQPEKILSEWVVASYRATGQGNAAP